MRRSRSRRSDLEGASGLSLIRLAASAVAATRRELAERCDGPDRDDFRAQEKLSSQSQTSCNELHRRDDFREGGMTRRPIATIAHLRELRSQSQTLCSERHRGGDFREHTARCDGPRSQRIPTQENLTSRSQTLCSERHRCWDYSASGRSDAPGSIASIPDRRDRCEGHRGVRTLGLSSDRYVREQADLVWTQWIGTPENKRTPIWTQ
jgi:hypothetical protein